MKSVLGALLLTLAICSLASAKATTLSALRRGPWEYDIVEGIHSEAILTASFTDTINHTGWSILEIHSVGGVVPDEELAYLAGKMEGNLTAPFILMTWKNTMDNYCQQPSTYCTQLQAFLTNNSRFMETQIQLHPESDYWHQVSLFLYQLQGLEDGYKLKSLEPLPPNALLLLQISGDLEDLEAALGGGGGGSLWAGSCSALVKLLPGNADLLVSQDTWGDYFSMLRTYKLYDLKFSMSSLNKSIVPGSSQSFSSYPGVLLSGDDYYLVNSGLVSMETTIGNNNPDLWKFVVPTSVFENIRAVIVNRLATSGQEWTNMFSMYNSGTYNNEWMVVDYKLFQKGKPLPPNVLWVLDQIPGNIAAADQTQVLVDQLYWPSYNIPFYSEIYNLGGFKELEEKYGSWFSYSGSPRAQIFARNHTGVTDVDSMIKLMRYNNFQHDPLSACNCTPPYSAENAISARSDLNPANGVYPFSALGHRSHGGVDSKVTSSDLFTTLSSWAVSGPTHDQLPVFSWSSSGFSPEPPLGHPDTFDFDPVLVAWNWNSSTLH